MSPVLWSLLSLAVAGVSGDTPANCTYQDVEGSWIFYESEKSGDSSLDCSRAVDAVHKVRLVLKYPNTAVDEFGNIGSWTMVYNQVREESDNYLHISPRHAAGVRGDGGRKVLLRLL